MNKKKILAIVLVVLVLILGAASVYVATQLSSRQAVAPNAPTSKPAAFDSSAETTNWIGSTACTATGSATAVTNVATFDVGKWAYKDVFAEGKTISSIMAGDTVVYRIGIQNTSTATESGMVMTDVLTGNNLDQLSYISVNAEISNYGSCSYTATTKTVTCTSKDVPAGSWFLARINVKVASTVTNGMDIKNTVTGTLNGTSKTATKQTVYSELAVASLVKDNQIWSYQNGLAALTVVLSIMSFRLVTRSN